MKIKNKFYMPDEDTHFTGEDYQIPHRLNSMRHVKEFKVAVDVGAHIGTWAVDLVRYFEDVWCFEPIEEHRKCLIQNLSIFKKQNYTILPYALGNENDKEVSLDYVAEGNSGTASITPNGKYTATIKTFDSFNIPRIDYLKVDIEGFELQFLEGARETIKRTKPVMNIEIKDTCERFNVSPEQIKHFITKELGMFCVGQTVKDYIYLYK